MANSYWAEFAERHHAAAHERAMAELAERSKKSKETGKAVGEAAGAGVKAYKAYKEYNQPDRQLGRASNY